MTAGIPGAGIGGLFYLIGAVALPVRSAWRRLRHRDGGPPLRVVLSQTGIALGILAGIWITGWLLGVILGPGVLPARSAAAPVPGTLTAANAVRLAAFLAGFLTLGAVLLTVQLARFAARRRRVATRA